MPKCGLCAVSTVSNLFRPARSLPSHSARRFLSGSLVAWAQAPAALLDVKKLETEEEHRLAREWTKEFEVEDIPKTSYEASYARSSGPGGQHVNTTSSKAVLRLSLQPAVGVWLPRYVLGQLSNTPHYLPSPPALLVSSQTSRSAPQNAQIALTLLHKTLLEAAKRPIQGETSAVQKEKVKGLAAAEKARTRLIKEKKSANKASRRGDF